MPHSYCLNLLGPPLTWEVQAGKVNCVEYVYRPEQRQAEKVSAELKSCEENFGLKLVRESGKCLAYSILDKMQDWGKDNVVFLGERSLAECPKEEDVNCVVNYTGSGHLEINFYLMMKNLFNDETMQAKAEGMYRVLARLPAFPGVAYNGLKEVTPKFEAALTPGRFLRVDPFMSTSESFLIAKNFSYNKIILVIKDGMGKSVQGHSIFNRERELLVGPHSVFKIVEPFLPPEQAKFMQAIIKEKTLVYVELISRFDANLREELGAMIEADKGYYIFANGVEEERPKSRL